MKIALNIILILNTLFVVVCADNPNVEVFALPALVFVVAGFLRIYHRDFVKLLTTYEDD